MDFCVLVKVSKRLISFWYQTDENPYAPLVLKESNEVPLYFYVNGNDFLFGAAARERFNQHDPDSYGNYFEIIKDPGKHFVIYGNKKPVKQLFYYGVEQHLSYFINAVLYKGDSIESYRQQFALRFLFEADIEDKEKTLIENLFTEAGYFNIQRMNFDEALFEVLVKNRLLDSGGNVLLLNGISDVLYLKFYTNLSRTPESTLKIAGQGADPRVKILAEMIIEYILTQNSFLNLDKEIEIASLLSYSAGLLNNITAVIKGDAELTDGNRYWFRINERSLNDRLQYYSKDLAVYAAIDDLLKVNNLRVENIDILLVGSEISTSYFSNKLLKKYPNVKAVDPACLNDAMKLVFSSISIPGTPAIKRVPLPPPVSTKQPVVTYQPAIIMKPPVPAKVTAPPPPPKKEITRPVAKPPPPVVKANGKPGANPRLPPPPPPAKT